MICVGCVSCFEEVDQVKFVGKKMVHGKLEGTPILPPFREEGRKDGREGGTHAISYSWSFYFTLVLVLWILTLLNWHCAYPGSNMLDCPAIYQSTVDKVFTGPGLYIQHGTTWFHFRRSKWRRCFLRDYFSIGFRRQSFVTLWSRGVFGLV